MSMDMQENYVPHLENYTPARLQAKMDETAAALRQYYEADPGVQSAGRNLEAAQGDLERARTELARIQHLYSPHAPERRAANLEVQQRQQVVASREKDFREAQQAAASKRLDDFRHKAGFP